jgi:hypothetical protein
MQRIDMPVSMREMMLQEHCALIHIWLCLGFLRSALRIAIFQVHIASLEKHHSDLDLKGQQQLLSNILVPIW